MNDTSSKLVSAQYNLYRLERELGSLFLFIEMYN